MKPGPEPQGAVGAVPEAIAPGAVAGAIGVEVVEVTATTTDHSRQRNPTHMPASSLDTDRIPPSSDLLHRVERVLDEQVRPRLRDDGGDLQVVGIDEDNIVQVRMLGAATAVQHRS